MSTNQNGPAAWLEEATHYVHRPNTAVWVIGHRVLVATSSMNHGALEEAGWTVAHDAGRGVIYETNWNTPDYARRWQALVEADSLMGGMTGSSGGVGEDDGGDWAT